MSKQDAGETKMINTVKKDKIMFLLLSLVIAAGVYLRAAGLPHSFEYDEIWTLRHYLSLPFSAVFTELETPNNHPLHTLFLQWSMTFFHDGVADVKYPAFVFGLATLFAGVWFTWKFTKRKSSVLLTASILSFHAYLIYYSHTARGYSLQTFFVLLTAVSLFQIARQKQLKWYVPVFLLSGICSCLSITSGLIFVCALCGSFLITLLFGTNNREDRKKIFLTFLPPAAGFVLFALLWYGANYSRIAAGQSFGSNVLNPLDFLKFCWDVSYGLLLIPLLLIHLAGIFFLSGQRRRFAAANLIFAGLVFLSATVTKAGPVRVYLPMVPVLTFGASLVLTALCRSWKRELLFPAAAFLSICYLGCCSHMLNKVVPPDWFLLSDEIIKEIPANIYVNYSSHDSFTAVHSHTAVKEDFIKRLSTVQMQGFLQTNSKGTVDFYSIKQQSPVSFQFPDPVVKQFTSQEGVRMDLYELEPLTEGSITKDQPVFLTVLPVRISQYQAFYPLLLQLGGEWHLSNLFLNHKRYAEDGEEIKAAAMFNPSANQEASVYLKLTEYSKGLFRFYTFRKTVR